MSIELQNVNRYFSAGGQRIKALQDIDLIFPKGSQVAITGESGAGKSTLLHIIGTLDRPSSGKVIIGGQDTSRLNDNKISRLRNLSVGFVFQMNNLLGEFSAVENVMMPMLIKGDSFFVARTKSLDLLSLVGLSARAEHRPGELSGGEQQRVAIARAISVNPQILLADEPTGNLDIKTSEIIQDLLLELCARHGITMLLVTHDINLAKKINLRVFMEDGRIIDRSGF
jgi:lipoprotein-releasing system ATP-binding protein